jgi:hypothetical protein
MAARRPQYAAADLVALAGKALIYRPILLRDSGTLGRPGHFVDPPLARTSTDKTDASRALANFH